MMLPNALGAPSRESAGLLEYVRSQQPIIESVALRDHVPPRDLTLQILLYLPRLVDGHGPPPDVAFAAEVDRLSQALKTRLSDYASWLQPPSHPIESVREVRFACASSEEARIIHERFHYLSSFRDHSLHFALRTRLERRLVALLTLSPFDLWHMAGQLPPEIGPAEVRVVSRVFAFPWAPRNTISHLMGHVCHWIRRHRPRIKMLLTYVNPNLGFTGASYRASNWVPFGRENGTRYAYLDGYYITDRQLVSRFRTATPQAAGSRLGDRLEVAEEPLAPLVLYAYLLDHRLRAHYAEGFDHTFWRP